MLHPGNAERSVTLAQAGVQMIMRAHQLLIRCNYP
jgi:hypothetical protein